MSEENQWLSAPQHQSSVEVTINRSKEKAAPILESLDFSSSVLLKLFFFLTGLKNISRDINGLKKLNFCILEQEENKTILGVKGKIWRLKKTLVPISKISFLKEEKGFTRITWSFQLKEISFNTTQLLFSISIESPDFETQRKMKYYWYIVKPLSTFIRRQMIIAMKQKITK